MSTIRKAGVPFYPGIMVKHNLSGIEDTLSIKYKLRGTDITFQEYDTTFTEEDPGVYTAPVTFDTVGDYIFIVESTHPLVETLVGNLIVVNASLDDISAGISNLQTDINIVKSQLDTLDNDALANLQESINGINVTVDNLKTLIINNTAIIYVTGDETAALTAGIEITGTDSGAKGKITESNYDANTDLTKVIVDGVIGKYITGETLTMPDGTVTTGTIDSIVLSPIDSVMEFINEINAGISDSGTSTTILNSAIDNMRLMLEGKEYTDSEGNAVSALDSHGLKEIFDMVAVTNNNISDKYNDLIIRLGNLSNSIDDAMENVNTNIDTAKSTILDSINSVNVLVSANKNILEDADIGLSTITDKLIELKTTVDNINNDDVIGILNDTTSGLDAIKTTIMDKLDIIDNKIDGLAVATGSRLFV